MFLNFIYQGRIETVYNFYSEDMREAFLKSQDELLKIGLGCGETYKLYPEQIIPEDLYNEGVIIINRNYIKLLREHKIV